MSFTRAARGALVVTELNTRRSEGAEAALGDAAGLKGFAKLASSESMGRALARLSLLAAGPKVMRESSWAVTTRLSRLI
ncbi:MAG: hypothetical protein EBY26_01525 [Microbacteriaceae bacterium]|nr:hypothetical protein [Microbacteriaceae bacterium]